MKGNPDVIKVLNEVLRKELTGVNQYFIHAKMCKNWGYAVLGEHAWNQSIDEMKTRGSNSRTDSFSRRHAERSSLRQDPGGD